MKKIYLIASMLFITTSLHAQQTQQLQPLTVEQRVGMEVGPIIVKAALASAENEQLKAQIASLQAKIKELEDKQKPKE